MKDVLAGSYSPWRWYPWPPTVIRVVDWNIERGLQLPGIIRFLEKENADILTLQEVDLNARRTGNRNVAEEIARRLKLNYVYGPEYQEMAEGVRGNRAYTGQATLSRWPIRNSRVIRFTAQSGFWEPRWYKPNLPVFQERIGNRIALFSEIDVAGRSVAVFNLHLESRGANRLRVAQLAETLAYAGRYPAPLPVLIAGDLNLDVSGEQSAMAIRGAGFLDAVDTARVPTTIRKGLHPGRSIDRILVRVGFASTDGVVHDQVRASDHFPISCSVSLTGPG